MIPTEQRARLLALIAKSDQEIAEATSLASDKKLRHRARENAEAWRSFHTRALKRVETMLG